MSKKVFCDRVLDRVKGFDASAAITSISRRDMDDAMLVRVRTVPSTAGAVLNSLRSAWPLATVSLVENLVTGRSEAQVSLPNERDQAELAMRMAHERPGQVILRAALRLLVVLFVGACVMSAFR
jgi:hypothetical protein